MGTLPPSFGPKPPTVKVLVVQTPGPVHQSLREVLDELGYQVSTVHNGSDGVQEAYLTHPTLIIADLMIEDINGYQLCRLIKNDPLTRSIPVLLVSAFEQKIDKFWGYKAGADGFIAHQEFLDPIRKHKLKDLISSLLSVYQKHGGPSEAPRVAPLGEDFNVPQRLNQILDKSLIESTLMNDFRQMADLAHDASLMSYMFFSLLESILDYDAAILFFNPPTRSPRKILVHLPEGKTVGPDTLTTLKQQFFKGLSQSFIAKDSANPQQDPILTDVIGVLAENDHVENSLMGPFETEYLHEFHLESTLIGAIALYDKQGVNYQAIFPTQLMLTELNMLVRLHYLYEQAAVRVITDDWTKLYTFRHFTKLLEKEFQRAKRYDIPFTLGVVDVDHLKQLNDQYGYDFGDDILKVLAQTALKTFRNVDILARSNRDDMFILFPETEMAQAQRAANRLCEAMAAHAFSRNGEPVSITLSIGLTELDPAEQSLTALFEKANEALRQAKQKGHNRVELYSGSS